MSTAVEIILLDENQRLKNRVAELETQVGREIVKTVVWTETTYQGRSAERWCQSYEVLRDALWLKLGQFFHDDDCAEEAIFEEGINKIGYALRLVQRAEETGAWVGTVNLADFSGEVTE